MSKQANPLAIGAFLVGALILLTAGVMLAFLRNIRLTFISIASIPVSAAWSFPATPARAIHSGLQ